MSHAAPRRIAVVDIGKTNAKLALHDLVEGRDLFVRTLPNTVLAAPPYPHFDVDRLWRFLLEALAECAGLHAVDALSVTTHGACAALVDADDLVLPILDYESPLPDELAGDYDRARPPFAETASPRLPGGLNVGAQLFWLEARFPEAFARARHLLPYPQYWAWRLTGTAAAEVTSLGCHTDLWEPGTGRPSRLARERGWDRLLPSLRSAFDTLGPLRPELAAQVGLAEPIPVFCGLHDSNASLLPHLLSRPAPFTVLSTGTWTVAMAVGGRLDGLDPARDTLANVDALGRPVPSGRFMGGREFDRLTENAPAEPSATDLARVLENEVMAVPSFAPGTGPFPGAQGRWSVAPETLSPQERTTVASLYAALMTERVLALIGAGGPSIVEGPFARNPLYLAALQALTARPVLASQGATGTTAGAALLALGTQAPPPVPAHAAAGDVSGLDGPVLRRYAQAWRRQAEA
ncbi:FGGY-family carbohydrate kinase [Aureimonas jatrophae]|uniref:Sugar (Pentulose or hexulose) kinase n=1 Tax=Aureimonas jatrophae TaxID=1166073 RepID=A0A1H0L9J2_9HYPH|nr:FGGY-family carbohydrate kinase [Aureimonas jatrophae]MBB3952457.1 sugar (pentulose or hexulose) kinase [Aureimonas jatrophae]SDO64620.1 Sugar (pentulose or hexulose) kinase [Aureimonas jatrophae]